MSDDFYTMVDSGDPAPDNEHITGVREERNESEQVTAQAPKAMYAARIAVYDDMLSTPRVIVIEPQDVRTYLEETTNTVYQCMKEQGGRISLMVIREIVENFIHAHFAEPIISILDGGDTIRFADQGPGIDDKERAFDFGVTSANSKMKRYIRGTGAGFPMVQEYLENAGGAVSIEDNMGNGTVVTVSLNPKRVQEIERAGGRGAAVRPETEQQAYPMPGAFTQQPEAMQQVQQQIAPMQQPGMPHAAAWHAPRARAPGTLGRDSPEHTRHKAGDGPGCRNVTADGGRVGCTADVLSTEPARVSGSIRAANGICAGIPPAIPVGIPAAVSTDAPGAVQPMGPTDASATLPTVAAKFSTAAAAHAEFSTTSSSNDVS